MKFNSKTIHGNQHPDKAYASVMPPIYQTSTYVIPEAGAKTAYGYSRTANPTRTAFENAMASLESGESGFAFASGMAAIDAVMR
ncbi:MAG: PLP-dependent transferase, partial [Flavobacteriaceae bacterium]